MKLKKRYQVTTSDGYQEYTCKSLKEALKRVKVLNKCYNYDIDITIRKYYVSK